MICVISLVRLSGACPSTGDWLPEVLGDTTRHHSQVGRESKLEFWKDIVCSSWLVGLEQTDLVHLLTRADHQDGLRAWNSLSSLQRPESLSGLLYLYPLSSAHPLMVHQNRAVREEQSQLLPSHGLTSGEFVAHCLSHNVGSPHTIAASLGEF